MSDCTAAGRAVADVDFVGWSGFPPGCAPTDVFPGLPGDDPDAWGVRPLGERFERASFTVLDLPGYYRPTVSVRAGELVLFDGMNPELDLAALAGHLGEPETRLDYEHGTLPVAAGEWAFPARGITLFVNTTGEVALHLAAYRATTVAAYLRDLRPHLGKTLRPRGRT